MTDPKTLALDPRWLPDALDAGRGVVRFARIDDDALRREAFLDARKDQSVIARAEARIDDLAPLVPLPPPASYVFHSAFCGSTLLARALDLSGRTLALKEPNILLDLANARRAHPAYASDELFRRHAEVVLRLIERGRAPEERVIIKPTNLALPLAPIVIGRGSRALLLYGSLREFLMSILKKGEEGRAFARKMFNIFALDRTPLGAIEPRQAMSLTDLQVAALVWRHQLEEFAAILNAFPRVASLDYASFIAAPTGVLRAASNLLALNLPAAGLDDIVSGPVFRADAKFSDRPFTAEVRRAANDEIEARHAPELTLIAGWAENLLLARKISLPLARPLNPVD
jgi:hypothetical protein